jgi:hypothetical protein
LERTCRNILPASKLDLSLAEGVAVDIRHAQMLARRLLDPVATLEQSDLSPAAVVALSGDLLPGWYDDWVLVVADDWRQLRLHALEALADRFTVVGCWGQAADAANAAVRAEPLRGSAHAALIQDEYFFRIGGDLLRNRVGAGTSKGPPEDRDGK